MAGLVNDQAITDFRNNGVVVLRGVFREWLDILGEGIAFNMENPSASGHIYRGEKGKGRFLTDFCNWQRIPQFRDFIFNAPAGLLAAQLMSSQTVRLFHDHVLVKEADADVATPWHQDQPYYCLQGPKTVSLWVSLDEVPRETAVEFIAGSHLWGKLFRPRRFSGQAEDMNERDDRESLPDINGNRADYDIVGWQTSPGDVVAFDYRTVHGAPINKSTANDRRAFSLRLVGDDTRFVRREGILTSPPFPNVKLSHGDALEGEEEFPVIYREM